MSIYAEVIADSVNPDGGRITSMLLTYPRWIHSQLMTHRAFSRNSSSSRAVPTTKLLRKVLENPAEPLHWGKNQKGMQAQQELEGWPLFFAKTVWRLSRNANLLAAWTLNKLGAHKQIVNRRLEPDAHVTTLVTATEWGNFFNLRNHGDAQHEIHALARSMWVQYALSKPKPLVWGEWHAPFLDKHLDFMSDMTPRKRLAISVARCARLSYETHYNVISFDEDYRLAASLRKDGHMSPFEHQALADPDPQQFCERYIKTGLSVSVDHRYCRMLRRHNSNFKGGWVQLRKLLPNENRAVYSPFQDINK